MEQCGRLSQPLHDILPIFRGAILLLFYWDKSTEKRSGGALLPGSLAIDDAPL
jgi:hypothetical protein